ncbi:hypothetical protein GEMRC1_013816 [Eukaryota sp. GEM-RC1]
MLTLSIKNRSYLLLPIVEKESDDSLIISKSVSQAAIECVNAIVSNTIMLGLPQDKPMYGLIVISPKVNKEVQSVHLKVLRVQKHALTKRRFNLSISPVLRWMDNTPESSQSSINITMTWLSHLLDPLKDYGRSIERALQRSDIRGHSLTLSHVAAFDRYSFLSFSVCEDLDQWVVVNATPIKATVVKLDEDGSPLQFGCVYLDSLSAFFNDREIIVHPRGKGPQWSLKPSCLFAVSDPGGVNILHFDSKSDETSVPLDQFVLLALMEILDVQQFDSPDPDITKMVHGDPRLPNFLYKRDEEGVHSLSLIDFEYASKTDAFSDSVYITRARADRPQVPPPLRFQRGQFGVMTVPSDDFYMFLYSLLIEFDYSLGTKILRSNDNFGYEHFSTTISAVSQALGEKPLCLPADQCDLFTQLLSPIAPNPPAPLNSFRKYDEDLKDLLSYEHQFYLQIRTHCERIKQGKFSGSSLYGHPSALSVIKRDMGSRVMRKTVKHCNTHIRS